MSVYGDPIAELVTRLTYHTAASGRLLWGYTLHPVPIENAEGQVDFPAIQLFIPDLTEAFRGSLHCEATMTMRLVVSIARKTTTTGALKTGALAELMDAVAAVANAIETRTDGEVKPKLGDKLTRPFDLTVTDSFVSETSLNAQVTLTLAPKIAQRGAR
jgi:hypothetical protein